MDTRLTQDCPATMIPAGTAVTLPAGTAVFVTQTLGGNVTVRTEQGLFRIARADAGAVEGLKLEAEAAPASTTVAQGDFAEKDVWDAMKTCFDPEIPVNIVDLG